MRRVIVPPAPTGVVPTAPPSFSVVVAGYQAAGTIGEALDSALGQTMPPAQVIVCDDGSTDDLDAVLAPYADSITLLRQRNAGEGAAKNAGARAATGDFVVFLDADDVFLPERLEALAELASARPDLELLTTDAFLEVGGTPVRRCYDESWTFEVDDQRGAILERNFVFGLAAVDRGRFLACGGFDESLRYATDWDLWCRLILDGVRAGLVAEPLARYRLHGAGLSAQRGRLLRGRCAVLEKSVARTDLSSDERRRVTAALARERRDALLAETREALLARAPGVRSLALRSAAAGRVPAVTRLRALLAVAAPGLAARVLERDTRRSGAPGQAGLRFPSGG